jgi:hypothetical protein
LRRIVIASIVVVIAIVVVAVGYVLSGMYLPSGTGAQTGTVKLFMTDPPSYSSNITSINITFTKIELAQLVGGNETWITLTGNATTIDLLKIVNSTQNLGSFQVPVGNYSQIRFNVSTATALINNQTVALTIPSGAETGLKVHFENPFQLTVNSTVLITIDINADNNGIHNGKLVPSMQATISS